MEILKMDNQGRGITYFNGKIVFVNNALTNEDVDIKLTLDKKKFSVADVIKHNKVSPLRIKPKCKYFNVCGGCQLQHLNYKNQLEYKKDKLNNIFNKLGINVDEIVSDTDFYYRNKLSLQIKQKVGLFKINSNDIVNIDECIICKKLINEKIKILNKLDLIKIKKIVLKTFENKIMIEIIGFEDLDLEGIYDKFDTIYLNNNLIKGEKIITKIGCIKYYISPDAFFQVNPYITEKMYNYIKNLCILNNSKYVFDLYCGCGSISLYIANDVDKVYGVEINKESIKDANKNKLLNNINNVSFKCDDTNNIFINNNVDTIIVDPPRSGLSKLVIKKILEKNVTNLIYVSCDPMTLQRDLMILNSKYDIKSIKAFDMFPNTYHVECVALLVRKNEKN